MFDNIHSWLDRWEVKNYLPSEAWCRQKAVTSGLVHRQTHNALVAAAGRVLSCLQRTWTHQCYTWSICRYPAGRVSQIYPENKHIFITPNSHCMPYTLHYTQNISVKLCMIVPIPWRPQTIQDTRHTTTATATKTWKTNSVLLRNRQIHNIVG